MGLLEDKRRARIFYKYLSKIYDVINPLFWTISMRECALDLFNIGPTDKILDVGCGNGELMKYINENISKDIRGIELSKSNVQKCVEKGLTVIEGDAEKDLKQFPDNSFDYVILSQTLQAFLDPENVLNELLRIGKKAIVSIPNFGHRKVRLHLLFKGTMPVTENLPNEWYNTPNLHMCTIKDFENYCRHRNIKINLKNLKFHNFFSELGIFVLEK